MTERKGRWRGEDKVREREGGGGEIFFHLFFSFFFFGCSLDQINGLTLHPNSTIAL